MKTTDLMIGDWVMLIDDTTGKPYKRAMITHIDSIRERIAAKTEINTFAAWRTKYIEPIPLTPEILEKNGWMKVEVDGVFYPKQLKGELPWIGYAINEDSWRFRIRDFCEIKYVHELQHALKPCGIEKKIVL